MLVIVALPVALIVRAPGPIYSTIALVPPETVNSPGDVKDHVLRRRPTVELAGQVHRDVPRIEHLPWQPGDDLDRVRAAHADRASTETTGIRRVRVGADDQFAGEGVIFQHHLMDDAGARPPEPQAVFGRGRAQEVIDFLVLGERFAQIRGALDPRLDQMVAMDRGRDRDLVAPGLHELEQTGLPQHILKNDAVGAQQQIAVAGLQLLVLRIVEMPEQDLVRQGQRLIEPAADHRKIARHCRVDGSRHFRGRFDSNHCLAFLGDT